MGAGGDGGLIGCSPLPGWCHGGSEGGGGALHLVAKAEEDNTLQLQMEDRATRSIQDVVAECSVLLVALATIRNRNHRASLQPLVDSKPADIKSSTKKESIAGIRKYVAYMLETLRS